MAIVLVWTFLALTFLLRASLIRSALASLTTTTVAFRARLVFLHALWLALYLLPLHILTTLHFLARRFLTLSLGIVATHLILLTFLIAALLCIALPLLLLSSAIVSLAAAILVLTHGVLMTALIV